MEPDLQCSVINLQHAFLIIMETRSRICIRGKSMSNQATHLNVKNLCSRKLWELASTRAVDDDQLRAVARELQLRRHYLQELETLQPKRTHH